MTRDEIIELAHECGIHVSEGNTFADDCHISVLYRFANKAIEHFLATTGQYVTNDASREAVIQAAVGVEREACAKVCESKGAIKYAGLTIGEQCAAAIRARGE